MKAADPPRTGAPLDFARIQAVIFDMDDTLLNWRQAENTAIGDLAIVHFAPLGIGEKEVRAHYDAIMAANYLSWRNTRTWWYVQERLQMLVDRLGLKGKVAVEPLAASFSQIISNHLDWLAGARELLRAARASGRKTALLTNGRSEVQRPKIEAFAIAQEVDFVGITGELGVWKPEAAAFQKVLSALGVPAQRALMVGDNLDFDILPAKALGMQTAWISQERQQHPFADITVALPKELLHFFGRDVG
jgi:putative hydrolase of the HAD superfamily